ncbi:hypothetical protein RIB2604_00301670 [Aspergillus luchuensis]|uniref:DUF7624 domain-containing protein n=1 Tax=Aspergillus kawachii TaxID=1069201 RepID=A0A146EYD3_ASPKA|nr:hypothetical protein RIB2604_00301670 [Aspergillus luchuensis]
MNAVSNSNPTKSDEDEPPKSVIHAPTGFGEFVNGVQYFSSPSQSESDGAETLASNVVAPPSVSTGPKQSAKENQYGPTSPPPLTTTSIQPARDWFERATPRAQTRQEFLDISKDVHSTSHKVSEMAVNHCEEQPLFTRPSVNRELASSRNANAEDAGQHTNGKPESHHSQVVQLSDEESEIRALQAALAECWALCNTLATLSSIHRERHGCTVDTREDVWRSCWRLCQELYDSHSDDRAPQINPTLDLCRDFCQTLFETRVRNDENADSVLRVSFELNNHLYNTHDRNPETPTTIFDDTATVSPDDAPVQNIFVLGQGPGQSSHAWSSNSSNISGQSQSSEQTSSTQTVKTSSRDPTLACVRILVTQAAINSGFQRVGPHSFPSFVKSLSSDAFGSMPWQVALLKNYKQLVAFDPTFRNVGPSARAGAADVACAVEVMMQSGQHLWLRDLYRLVFGFHIEEAVNRKVPHVVYCAGNVRVQLRALYTSGKPDMI